MSLKENFFKLIKTVYGKIPKQDKDVKNILQQLNSYYSNNEQATFFDLLNNIASQNSTKDKKIDIKDNKNVQSILQEMLSESGTSDTILNDLFSRRAKYNNYTSLIKKVSRLKRAIKIIRSNIISSDSLHNDSLIVSEKSEYEDDVDINKFLEETNYILQHIGIEKKKKQIIDKTLKYGDYFLEIVNTKEVLKSTGMLQETIKLHVPKNDEEKTATFDCDNIQVNLKLQFNRGFNNPDSDIKRILLENCPNLLLEWNDDILLEYEKNKDNNEIKNHCSLNDVLLLNHNPHNVIKLNIGNMKIGYIVVPDNFQGTGIGQMFGGNSTLSGFSQPHMGMSYGSNTYTPRNGSYNIGNAGNNNSNSTDIDNWRAGMSYSKSLGNQILQYFEKNINKDIIKDNPELRTVVVNVIFNALMSGNYELSRDGVIKKLVINDLKFRFVPVDYMQEFSIDIDDYSPYGTSILDHVEFDSKMLVSDKISSTIERLTRSIERRIIEFEVDNRDSVSVVQRLKEKLRKTKVMFDDSCSVDTIPTAISPFEDYYIPTRDGTRFVNFSTEGITSNAPQRIEDMKFLRDEIVSNLEIPPAYLGLEENIESKNTLTLQNVIFAVTILDYQEVFSEAFTELIDKIKKMTNKMESFGKIYVTFSPPVILTTSSELEHISNVANVEDFLTGKIGLSKNDIIQRYLPYLKEYVGTKGQLKTTLDNLTNKTEESKEGEESTGGF